MRASCATGARLSFWRDGRSRACPCSPHGRRWWLSCSRLCSATVDAPSRALHRRIVLSSRLPFSNCEECGHLTVEPAKQVGTLCREDRRQTFPYKIREELPVIRKQSPVMSTSQP